jgi:hypothetical protein
MEDLILRLINSIFKTGQIPDILKVGLLNPIFKNKGDKNNSTNYRGISIQSLCLYGNLGLLAHFPPSGFANTSECSLKPSIISF